MTMTDPQSELFKMLADSQLRMSHIQQIHAKHHASIPARQTALLGEIEQMRAQIQSNGVGSNPELEDQYLDALDNFGRLDNSYEMGKRFVPNEPPQEEELPEDLEKMARLGRVLLGVYSGELQKSAAVCADLERVGLELMKHSCTKELGDRLCKSATS